MERLGYTQLWLESGILTENFLALQLSRFDSGEDSNTEHYRYETLTRYFNLHTSFNNELLNSILQLLENDPDKLMAGSAVKLLLETKKFSDEQFKAVINSLKQFGKWTEKPIDRALKERVKRIV